MYADFRKHSKSDQPANNFITTALTPSSRLRSSRYPDSPLPLPPCHYHCHLTPASTNNSRDKRTPLDMTPSHPLPHTALEKTACLLISPPFTSSETAPFLPHRLPAAVVASRRRRPPVPRRSERILQPSPRSA